MARPRERPQRSQFEPLALPHIGDRKSPKDNNDWLLTRY
jgi:hypothetical protein